MGKEIAESCFPFTLGCHSFGTFPLVAGGQFIPGGMSSGEYGGGKQRGAFWRSSQKDSGDEPGRSRPFKSLA